MQKIEAGQVRRSRVAALVAALLMLSSCASGKRQTTVDSTTPDLRIPVDLMAEELRPTHQPRDGSDSELLRDHVAAMDAYHALRIRIGSLVCVIASQAGVTINGAKPVRPAYCDAREFRDSKAIDGR
jgi:hypothetical protein